MPDQPQPDEHTPLIAVVTVAQPRPRPRYTHSRVRRCCTWCLGTFLFLSIACTLLTLIFVPDCKHVHGHHKRLCIPEHPFYRNRGYDNSAWNLGAFVASNPDDPLDYADLVNILNSTPNEDKAREWSNYYTSGPHLAGKNLSQAEWTRDRWIEFGVPQTEIVAYDVYINYPKDHRLALLEKSTKSHDAKNDWTVKYEASLEEDVLEEDETSGLDNRIPTFHGYSASGNVTGQFVFVNYGLYQDFEDLLAANISLKGKIALAKYGHIFRGLKVKRAEELGMIGCVIYTDPGDDGNITEANGYKTYPNGPARNPSSVQRGSVQFLCKYHLIKLNPYY
jgi:N-acetylated-alpha-linked acidic dipeptidase